MAYSANQEQVFSPRDQSGVSNFALGERKLRKNALCFDQSAFSNFALYVIIIIIVILHVAVIRHTVHYSKHSCQVTLTLTIPAF